MMLMPEADGRRQVYEDGLVYLELAEYASRRLTAAELNIPPRTPLSSPMSRVRPIFTMMPTLHFTPMAASAVTADYR